MLPVSCHVFGLIGSKSDLCYQSVVEKLRVAYTGDTSLLAVIERCSGRVVLKIVLQEKFGKEYQEFVLLL